MIHLVLLSGGSGSRLWPLSNSARSKQFLKVLRDESGNRVSMVQRVFDQIRHVHSNIDITIATSVNQQNAIQEQLEGDYALVLEPERRDTAPAIMLACANLDLIQNANMDDTVVVMPIDTYADQDYYDRILDLDAVVQSNTSDLVLLGVKPTYPSEKYGYIIPDSKSTGVQSVAEFKEKPNTKAASNYINQGGLWNCGVFAFKLGYIRSITNLYVEHATFGEMVTCYDKLPKNSFDYEIVEKSENIAVVPYSGVWKDLGTWNTLTEEMPEWVQGRAVTSKNRNVHVINETGLPMVVSGLSNAVVVATHDGILACSKDASADIKRQVEEISESRPMYEKRYWGEYRVIDSSVYGGNRHALAKELVIAANRQLSYQRHLHRAEVWTVVAGKGEAVIDGHVETIASGSVLNIPPHTLHAVRAFDDLHIIEVQIGAPLVEEDIKRFGYYWQDSNSDPN